VALELLKHSLFLLARLVVPLLFLALPLADVPGGRVVRMLIGAVPMDQAPLSFADIFAMNARLGIDPLGSAVLPVRPIKDGG
jgi:hypothetical protein